MTSNSEIQSLLDMQADLSNRNLYLSPEYDAITRRIKELRGNTPPSCYGYDDCSTTMLVSCPWRMSCGT